MEQKQPKISVRELMEEIKLLMKDELVATYIEEDSAVLVHFPNGQNFRIFLEEV